MVYQDLRWLAQAPAVCSLRLHLFTLKTGTSIRLAAPVDHQVCSPGEHNEKLNDMRNNRFVGAMVRVPRRLAVVKREV